MHEEEKNVVPVFEIRGNISSCDILKLSTVVQYERISEYTLIKNV